MNSKHGYNKRTPKWKRIISHILILVMVLTTAPMTEVAQAAELPVENSVESTDGNLVDSTDIDSTESTDTDSDQSDLVEDTESSSTNEENENNDSTESSSEENNSAESTEAEEAESTTVEETVSTEEEEPEVEESVTAEPEKESDEAEEYTNDAASTRAVAIRYLNSSASTVQIAGSFNGWTTETLDEVADGIFMYTGSIAAGDYEFKFIIDGSWQDGSNRTLSIAEGSSVVIDDKQVTITYENSSASSVYIAGGMNSWSSTSDKMQGSSGVFTYTATLSPGYYNYKFVVDGSNWIADPLSTNFEIEENENRNSFFVIPGLEELTEVVTKGTEKELPATLNSVADNGVSSAQTVTYTLKTEDASDYVTIDGNKVTVSTSYAGDTLELTATAANGQTSTVTLELVDKQYKYTVYAYSTVASHMSADDSALYIWDKAGETAAAAAEYEFTELVELEDGNSWLKAEVTLPFAKEVGMIFKSKGSWTWKTSDLIYKNTEGKDVTLYIVEGQTEIFESLDDIPDGSEQRYVIIEYTRSDNDYTDTNVYAWDTGYGATEYAFESVNGKYLGKIPIIKSSSDKKIGFIVKKGAGWDGSVKDGEQDNFVTIAADQKILKVRYANGAITKILPDNCGSGIDRTNNKITFYYRDDALYAANNMSSLSGKVQLVMKSSTGSTSLDGTYTMTYDADNERFYYELPLEADTDYCYYYKVDGTNVLDVYNSRTTTIDNVEYSLIRNKNYQVNLLANVRNAEMDYNDNNLLYINWKAKDGADIDGFTPEKIYADLSQLGLGKKVEIDTELNALTFSCKDDIALGTKKITVTLIDDCDNTFTAETSVTVKERTKTENTSSKLGDFDWDEAVIYFAVTDRFFDGNAANNTATEGYNAADTTDAGRYHGGDFAGLTAKIDYLYDLGVNTIWITPIVDNVDGNFISDDYTDADAEYYGYHGYWASDFTKLNPHLGTEEELEALINAAHAKGMKIMVDVVLNHGGYDSEDTFNSILTDGEGKYINMIRGAEETEAGDEKKDGLSGLPDFLTENEEVRNQLVEWQTTWMTKFDIDYYRVDTVKHVEDTTWAAFKNALTESNPDFKLIGEYYGASYGNTYGQLDSGKMDSLLDFGFKYYAEDFVNGSISSVEASLAARNAGIDNTATLGSFLSSHDEDGLLYKLKNKTDDESWAEGQMKVAATLQITAKGQPVIYYGEEIGLSGANNWPYYDNRYDFDWAEVTAQKSDTGSLYNHYKKMLNIRRDYSEVFAKGTRSFVAGSDKEGYEVIRRSYEGSNIYVGMNVFGDAKTTTFAVTAAEGSVYTDLYSNTKYTVSKEGTVTVKIPGARDGGTVVLALTKGEETEIKDTNTITLKLHYYRKDGKYSTDEGSWNAWLWTDKVGGKQYDFVEENGEMVATMEVGGRATTSINYIIRLGEWKQKDVDADQSIDVSDIVSGTVHFYVNAGVAGGTRVLGADAILGSKIVTATYDRDTNKVIVVTSQPISQDPNAAFAITRSDGTDIEITNVEVNDCTYTLTIKPDLTPMSEIVKSYTISYDGYDYKLVMPNIYSSDEFETAYTYDGDDLGATWSKDSTTFKVWAPTADYVQLALYASGDAEAEDLLEVVDMKQGEKGVWTAVVDGDINGTYYTYLVAVNGKVNEACDPYATTTGVNGKRAMVIDLDSTDPEGWAEDVGPHKDMEYTDAVLYELHVRDASIDESSGVSDANKGKFLGLTETGTTTANGVSTGLDHLVDLGVTHVHLLPVYDYGSVDETKLDEAQFNWGYDPVNFNVPEGSYSTDPYNGEVRVKEMKQMVKTLHDNNINVVMDVVYNHVYDADSYCFNQIVPQYFSRTNEDGSYNGDTGCGNTTASERAMVQKYIVDSVLYWHEEYHIDGFRFDLVGLIDAETMNAVVEAVHAVDPDVIFYGEGWSMSSGTTKGDIPMATQAAAKSNLSSGTLAGLAYFSDTIRDNVAGNNTNGEGFVLGYADKETIMKQCFTATTSWCPGPTYTVNYASCHDNYTLMDKLNVAAADATEEERIKMNNLTAAIYMTSQGIPFIHAGEEFLRTKVAEDGEIIHNSYNSPDYVNKLRWSNLEDEKYADVYDYYKGLIEFRKNHEALRLTTASDVSSYVSSYTVGDSLLLFKIAGKDKVAGEVSDGIVVIFNANKVAKTVNLSTYGITGDWKVCINAEDAGTKVLGTVNGTATVDAISALVLVQGDTVDPDTVYGTNFKETITLDKTALQLKAGESATVKAAVNVAGANVTWSSDNTEVATVDGGVVTAVASGTAVITAQTANGTKATCTVKVYEHSYTISKEELTLDITSGQTETLKVSSSEVASPVVTWSTSDETVVTVSKTGLVTPTGVGSATVTAAVKDGPELTCQVTVTSSLESITIITETLEMVAGDTQTLSVICNPASANPDVKWFSSNSAVATINRTTGVVTAVKAGTVTISAVAEGKKATCTVTVTGKTDEDTIEIPTGITAITNIHTKLSDVALPDDWAWVYGATPMKAFVGVNQKNFQATYTEEGCAPVTKEIPVTIITVSKVNLTTDAVIGKDQTATVKAEIAKIGSTVPSDMVTVEWKSSKTDVLSVTPSETDALTAEIKGLKAGKSNITAVVTISDGNKSKKFTAVKKNIRVVEGTAASISWGDITGFDVEEGKRVHAFTGETKVTATIASSATKVTLKSSDTSVVKVGAAKAGTDGNFTAELTIKKAGYVRLTATANDAMKTTTTVDLYVKDAVPNVSTNKVELNNKSANTASVFVYPSEGYEIEAVSLKNTDGTESTEFALTQVGDTAEYKVSIVAADKKTYKQRLSIKIKDVETLYTPPLTISVASKAPAVTVEQTAKVNLFYTDADANGSLSLKSTEKITNVTLSDCDFEYNNDTKEISIKADADRTKLDKKGILSITFEGYAAPVEKKITITTEDKAPKLTLSAKAATLYPAAGIESAQVTIANATTGESIAAEDMTVTFKQIKGKDVKAYTVEKSANTVSFTRNDSTFTSKATATIAVLKANYSKPVPLTYAISVNAKAPALVLSKNTITLNENASVAAYETYAVKVSVKNAPTAEIAKLSVGAADAKAQKELGRSIVFSTTEDGTVVAKLNDTKELKKGNYKFNVYAKLTDNCTVKTKVTVKVVNVAAEKTVKLSAKGSIDVLNRDTTAILYTPKLTNITGNITDVKLTGRSSHLFKAELVDGKIKVTVKGDSKEAQNAIKLVTKYNYGVKMQLALDNGCKIVTNEVKIKLKQSKPKVTVTPKQAAMFNNVNENTVAVAISAANKDGSVVDIEKIELTNFTDAFSYENGELVLKDRGAVKKGKTYSLKFNVYFEGCADSEKATTVTYKVKVN